MKDIALVTMRISDMTRMHPQQATELCSKCQHPVGVYPTGQKILAEDPNIKIICNHCSMAETPKPGDEVALAGSMNEILQESKDSFDVKGHA